MRVEYIWLGAGPWFRMVSHDLSCCWCRLGYRVSWILRDEIDVEGRRVTALGIHLILSFGSLILGGT